MTWQAAVRAWVVAGSGIDLARVLWADQGGPRLSSADGPWISLRELGEDTGGADWLVTTEVPLVVDLEVTDVDATANTLTAVDHGLISRPPPPAPSPIVHIS